MTKNQRLSFSSQLLRIQHDIDLFLEHSRYEEINTIVKSSMETALATTLPPEGMVRERRRCIGVKDAVFTRYTRKFTKYENEKDMWETCPPNSRLQIEVLNKIKNFQDFKYLSEIDCVVTSFYSWVEETKKCQLEEMYWEWHIWYAEKDGVEEVFLKELMVCFKDLLLKCFVRENCRISACVWERKIHVRLMKERRFLR